MAQIICTDRSRIETYQRCPRQRWLEYHEQQMGVRAVRKPLALAVGGSVHRGLEQLLRASSEWLWHGAHGPMAAYELPREVQQEIEHSAVAAALADFSRYLSHGLELDSTELAAQQTAGKQPDYLVQLAASLGTTPEEAGLAGIAERGVAQKEQFDSYLAREQSALVEALVRAWSRRRLMPLLEQYEVLEVEREGEWLLTAWDANYGEGRDEQLYELWFMSRPDALLRERATNQLYLLSFKTAAYWDDRKVKDAQHDMQGLSEGVEIEQRLREWWKMSVDNPKPWKGGLENFIPRATFEFLLNCAAPPQIAGIRYEYLLKGDRRQDKDLTAQLGMEARTQRSHLIQQYVAVSTPQKNSSYSRGDVCWSWDFIQPEDQRKSKLAWQNWKQRAVWQEPNGVARWIDQLDAAEEVWSGEDATVGLKPRRLGWRSPAQEMGYTEDHPLDCVFPQAVIVYRNDDELRDWIEQVEAQEKRVAQVVAEVGAAQDEGEKRRLLNIHFPQNRRACEYPGTCQFARDKVSICWGTDEMRRDPVGSGEYCLREPNHPQELVKIKY